MTGCEQVRVAIDSADQAVAAASALVAAGNEVDLSGLDRIVAALCAGIATLPRAERQGFKPSLLALIDGLGRLVGQLEAQHKAIAGQLGGLTSRRSAVSAYGKGAGAAGPAPRRPEPDDGK